MAEVLHFGTTYDEALQNAELLSEAVDHSREQLEAANTAMASGSAALSDHRETLQEAFATLTHAVQEMHTGVESAITEVVPVAESFQGAMSANADRLEQGLRTVSTMQDTVTQAVAEVQTELDAAFATAQEMCSETTTAITQLAATLQESQAATQTLLTDLTTAMGTLQQRVHAFQAEVESDFAQVHTSLTEHATAQVEALFGAFAEELLQTQVSQLLGSFTDFETGCTQLCSTFQADITDMSNRFMTRGHEILHNTAGHVQDTVRRELQEAFDDVVRSVIRALMHEVIETTVVMELGAQVTGMLSPILPELVVAKHALGAINAAREALDTLNPFRHL